MPRLSIVIPALGDTTRLENGLVSVLENRPAETEVIVVLRQAYDDPYGLAGDEVRFVEAPARSGLAECVNLGVATSRAAVVHVLGCGCEVTPGWADAALAHFADPRVATVAPLAIESGTEPARVLAAGVDLDRTGQRVLTGLGSAVDKCDEPASFILGPATFAAFYRTEALARLGITMEPSLGDWLCDVDLALRLQRIGYLALLEPASQLIGDALLAVDEPCGYAQALHAERLHRRHVAAECSTSVRLAHGAAIASSIARSLPRWHAFTQLAGRLQGTLEGGRHRRLQHELALLRSATSAARHDLAGAAGHLRIDAHDSAPGPSAAEGRRVRARA